MVEIVHASSQPTLIATPLKRGRSPYKSLFMRLSGLCPSYVAAVQILYNGYHWGEGHGKVAEFCHLLVFCVVRKNDPARRHHFPYPFFYPNFTPETQRPLEIAYSLCFFWLAEQFVQGG